MLDNFTRSLLRIATAQIAQNLGFQSAMNSTLDVLQDVMNYYLQNISNTLRFVCDHAGRTNIIFDDVGLVFAHYGVNMRELKEYMQQVGPVPFKEEIPRYPVKHIEPNKYIANDYNDQEISESHVPYYFPSIPSENNLHSELSGKEPSISQPVTDVMDNASNKKLSAVTRNNYDKKQMSSRWKVDISEHYGMSMMPDFDIDAVQLGLLNLVDESNRPSPTFLEHCHDSVDKFKHGAEEYFESTLPDVTPDDIQFILQHQPVVLIPKLTMMNHDSTLDSTNDVADIESNDTCYDSSFGLKHIKKNSINRIESSIHIDECISSVVEECAKVSANLVGSISDEKLELETNVATEKDISSHSLESFEDNELPSTSSNFLTNFEEKCKNNKVIELEDVDEINCDPLQVQLKDKLKRTREKHLLTKDILKQRICQRKADKSQQQTKIAERISKLSQIQPASRVAPAVNNSPGFVEDGNQTTVKKENIEQCLSSIQHKLDADLNDTSNALPLKESNVVESTVVNNPLSLTIKLSKKIKKKDHHKQSLEFTAKHLKHERAKHKKRDKEQKLRKKKLRKINHVDKLETNSAIKDEIDNAKTIGEAIAEEPKKVPKLVLKLGALNKQIAVSSALEYNSPVEVEQYKETELRDNRRQTSPANEVMPPSLAAVWQSPAKHKVSVETVDEDAIDDSFQYHDPHAYSTPLSISIPLHQLPTCGDSPPPKSPSLHSKSPSFKSLCFGNGTVDQISPVPVTPSPHSSSNSPAAHFDSMVFPCVSDSVTESFDLGDLHAISPLISPNVSVPSVASDDTAFTSQDSSADDEVWICPQCEKRYVDGENMVACDMCDNWFHWQCVGLTQAPPVDAKWFCPACKKREVTGAASNNKRKRKKPGDGSARGRKRKR